MIVDEGKEDDDVSIHVSFHINIHMSCHVSQVDASIWGVLTRHHLRFMTQKHSFHANKEMVDGR
jgi:hypothetical protein